MGALTLGVIKSNPEWSIFLLEGDELFYDYDDF